MATAAIEQPKPRLAIPPAMRIALGGMSLFLIFVCQIAVGASLPYASLVSLYIVLAVWTITNLGGVLSVPGLVVTANATIHVAFSQILKIFKWQNPEVGLNAPVATMFVLVLGMTGCLLASFTLRSLRHKTWKSLLPTKLDPFTLNFIAGSLFILSVIAETMLLLGNVSTDRFQIGGIFGIARTLIKLLPISSGLACAASILKNKRIFSPLVLAIFAFGFAEATIEALRQTFLSLVIIVLLTALLFRHKFKWYELVAFLAMFVFYQQVFSPYCLYARSRIRQQSTYDRVTEATSLLKEFALGSDKYIQQRKVERARYLEPQRNLSYFKGIDRFTFIDRLSLLPVIDNLVSANLDTQRLGFESTIWGFRLSVPSFIMPDKPIVPANNLISHKGKNLIGPIDQFTQPAIGFEADAFVSFGFFGVFATSFILGFIVFSGLRIVYGQSLLHNAIAAGIMFANAMAFTEGSISSITTVLLVQTPMFVVAMLTFNVIARSLKVQRKVTLLPGAAPTEV